MRAGVWLYRVTVGLAGTTLALVVAYVILVQENRSVQAEVNQRQQFINQSIQLGHINDALIRGLATAAVNNKDDKLRDLLAQNGITISTSGEPSVSGCGPSGTSEPLAAQPPGTGR